LAGGSWQVGADRTTDRGGRCRVSRAPHRRPSVLRTRAACGRARRRRAKQDSRRPRLSSGAPRVSVCVLFLFRPSLRVPPMLLPASPRVSARARADTRRPPALGTPGRAGDAPGDGAWRGRAASRVPRRGWLAGAPLAGAPARAGDAVLVRLSVLPPRPRPPCAPEPAPTPCGPGESGRWRLGRRAD
jgi:hypothetical protein